MKKKQSLFEAPFDFAPGLAESGVGLSEALAGLAVFKILAVVGTRAFKGVVASQMETAQVKALANAVTVTEITPANPAIPVPNTPTDYVPLHRIPSKREGKLGRARVTQSKAFNPPWASDGIRGFPKAGTTRGPEITCSGGPYRKWDCD